MSPIMRELRIVMELLPNICSKARKKGIKCYEMIRFLLIINLRERALSNKNIPTLLSAIIHESTMILCGVLM